MDEQIKVNVEFTSMQAVQVRRLIRESADVLRHMIAQSVMADSIDTAKRQSEELAMLELALEAVRLGMAERHANVMAS